MKYTQRLICGLLILLCIYAHCIWICLEKIYTKEFKVNYEIGKVIYNVQLLDGEVKLTKDGIKLPEGG